MPTARVYDKLLDEWIDFTYEHGPYYDKRFDVRRTLPLPPGDVYDKRFDAHVSVPAGPHYNSRFDRFTTLEVDVEGPVLPEIPPAVSPTSAATSATEAYTFEFAVFDTARPDTARVRVGAGAWIDLLELPPAPILSVETGNFQNTVTVTALTGHTVVIYRDGVQVSATTPFVDSGLTAGQAYSYTATQTDENGNTSPQSAPQTGTPTSAPQLPQANLIADYRFTETEGQLIDQVGGHHGTPTANVTRNGRFYRSAADGTSRLPLPVALETLLNGKSGGFLGALIRIAAVPAAVSQIASISAALSLGLTINPRLRAGVRAGGTSTLSTPAINLALNAWNYLAVDYQYDAGTVTGDLVAILEETAQPPVSKTGTLSIAGDPYIFTTESQTSPASSMDIALLHVYDASKRPELSTIYDFVQSVKTERGM